MNAKKSLSKTSKSLTKALPLIIGTILLVSFIATIVPQSFYSAVFSKNSFLDSLIGALLGSLSTGTPITSYILGGEMLGQGVSLIAVTAFIVAWVSVGIIQLPAEASILGKKFALLRNASAFVLSIIVALITVLIISFI